jgi:hypothetical protein
LPRLASKKVAAVQSRNIHSLHLGDERYALLGQPGPSFIVEDVLAGGEGKFLKFYIEFNCLDHERIAQGFKFDSQVRIGPRAPKTLVRLFKPIVWSRSVWQ